MLIYWLWLASRPGLSDREKLAVLQHFSEPEELYYADKKAFDHIAGLSDQGREALLDKDLTQARQIERGCQEEQLHILTYRDAAYPRRLQNIPDPPVVLYYKGRLPQVDEYPVIGVVGTRSATAYGLTCAKRLGYQIGRCGGIVVSGMAKGIDGLAMAGALTAGAPVIGVLGCGADMVYPASNRALFQDTQRFGCILSEFPPGTPPAKWTFPKRNRIISGLSCGVLVVEAPEKSGALITARLAAEQGRDVFAVPGTIDNASCMGSNALLREGAAMACCGWDIMQEYALLYPDKIRKDTDPSPMTLAPEEGPAPAKVAQNPERPRKNRKIKKELGKDTVDNQPPSPYSEKDVREQSLSQEEQQILRCLEQGERLTDDIVAETGLTTGKLLAALTMLELKGIVKRLPGKRITLRKC